MEWLNVNKKNNDYILNISKYESQKNKISIESAHIAIQKIVKSYPKPYTLFLSGGVDSQAMLWAWHTSGYQYEALSFVYNDNFNLHDLDSGMPTFAKIHNLKIDRKNIDLLSFHENEYTNYAEKYRCGSPHICSYMYMADQITEGTVIFSGSAALSKQFWYTKNEWKLYSYSEHSKQVIPMFFSFTKDIHYSFIEKAKNERSKGDVYRRSGFPVVDQPIRHDDGRKGYSGFEKIKEYYDNVIIPPRQKLNQPFGQTSVRSYDLLFRNPYEFRYASDKYIVNFV